MTSPMKAPALHDQLVLLDGSKRWPVPGVSRVQVGIAANTDTQNTAGEGTAVTQMNEATGEVSVDVMMWTSGQWQAYQSLLKLLRRGTKSGPALFTTAHPEIRGRGIKRLYFVSEQQQPYNPKDGYRASLKFSEKLKDKASAQAVGDQTAATDAALGITSGGGQQPGTPASTTQGNAVYQAALTTSVGPPAPADGGRASTATPGYCSASVRVAATKAGMSPALFGGSALQTEGNFRKAGLSQTWGPDTMRNLQNGDIVFWANDPSNAGHIGVVTGRDKDGMPLVTGNNLVTYRQRGGRFDASGRPIDRHIDSRGTVRLDQLSSRNSQPTSVGRAGGFKAAPTMGPAVPVGVPLGAPSRTPIKPPGR